jgi:hypothetical protein
MSSNMEPIFILQVFHGPAAWIIRWFMRKNLGLSFEAMANGLKKYTEERSAESTSCTLKFTLQETSDA